MSDPAMNALVKNGTIKSYEYKRDSDMDCGTWETLEMKFPNGQTLHIHSTAQNMDLNSGLSIYLQ